MTANKGAVAVELSVGGTSLCFVNAHLAAHAGMSAQRHWVLLPAQLWTHRSDPRQAH
ncbi:hypothetical protein T492DRAFT_896078 [Pavlovales sp. CCMP2436]|nr:hypothetical protein T492DRAFT_896078 [Pavlovales sp. CCMP2436]